MCGEGENGGVCGVERVRVERCVGCVESGGVYKVCGEGESGGVRGCVERVRVEGCAGCVESGGVCGVCLVCGVGESREVCRVCGEWSGVRGVFGVWRG